MQIVSLHVLVIKFHFTRGCKANFVSFIVLWTSSKVQVYISMISLHYTHFTRTYLSFIILNSKFALPKEAVSLCCQPNNTNSFQIKNAIVSFGWCWTNRFQRQLKLVIQHNESSKVWSKNIWTWLHCEPANSKSF